MAFINDVLSDMKKEQQSKEQTEIDKEEEREARRHDINLHKKAAESMLEKFKTQIKSRLDENGGKSYTAYFQIESPCLEVNTISTKHNCGLLATTKEYIQDVYYLRCLYVYDELKKFCEAEGIQITEPKLGFGYYVSERIPGTVYYRSQPNYSKQWPVDKGGYIRVKYRVYYDISSKALLDFHFQYKVTV